MLSGIELFIFIFLGICGAINALRALLELVLPAEGTVYLRVGSSDELECRVRAALLMCRGEVVIIPDKSKCDSEEFKFICERLTKDEPRVRIRRV